MASFKDQYDELFGASPPYDPIKLRDRTEQRADDMLALAPDATPEVGRRSALPVDVPTASAPAAESGFLENVGRQIGAGTVQVGEMALGGAEYVARQNEFLDGIVADTIYGGRRGLAGVREGILEGINEEDLLKASREWTNLDPNSTIWQGGPVEFAESVIYKAANALPATLATLYPPIKLAKMGLTTQAVVAMGASEGVLSMGGIANEITDEIMATETEQLMIDSPRFAELVEQTGNADEARRQLITEAQGAAPLIGGATVAAISSVAGRYFTPIFEKEGGAALGSRLGRGFAAEAPAEGSQGAVEQFVQNYAARIYDADRNLSEGVAEAFVGEGAIGGLMGAGAGGMFGERPAAPPPPPVDPNARPEITEQPDLPGMPPGGPAEVLPDELDQPTPEPAEDIRAQIDDLLREGTTRRGVYITPGTDERYVATLSETLPDDLTFVRNVDGKGGHLITKSAQLGYEAQQRIAQGASHQEVIGQILGIGRGKPTDPNSRVVQLLAEDGSVARESVAANQQEAEALGLEWSKEPDNKDRRIAVLTPQQAIERRQTLGYGGGDVAVQEDMFDNRAARGTDIEPVPTEEPTGQQDLPLVQKQRGVRPQPIGPQQIDEEIGQLFPEDEEPGLDPYEVDRRQYGMDFETPVETRTTTREVTEPTPDIAVQVLDKGEIVETNLFGNREAAEEYADELAAEYPDFQIRVAPHTRKKKVAQTRARRGKAKPIEPLYEQPIEDEIRDDIRSTVPFEERDEVYRAVEGSRSVQQASEKLTGEAAAARAAEEADRIGGFYNPNRLEFKDPEYEKAYRAAWEKKDTKEMGKIRQVAKPKLIPAKSESLIRAAQKVSPATRKELKERAVRKTEPEPGPKKPGTATPQRGTEKDYLGEFEYMTREQIDKLEGRALDEQFERAVTFREGREADTKVEDDVVKVDEPVEEDVPELTGELKFQKETKAKEDVGQEVEYTARIDRAKYRTPGQKKKFIRREAEHKRRRDTGQRSVKATPVRKSGNESKIKQRPGESEAAFGKRLARAEQNKKFDTAPLTQENYKLDEGVDARLKRIADAKKTREELRKAATRARTHLRQLKAKKNAIADNIDPKLRKDFLYARNYLEQLIEFARSIQAAKSESSQSITLAKGVTQMLDAAPKLTNEQFAKNWGAVAKKNEFDDLANLKWTNLSELRVPAKRAEATEDTNKRIAGERLRRILKRETVDVYVQSDPLFKQFIEPVMKKMLDSIYDNATGKATMPYTPSKEEIAEIHYAMNSLRRNGDAFRATRRKSIEGMQGELPIFGVDKEANVYEPLVEELEYFGFQFDESGDVEDFSASPHYLSFRYRERFKGQDEVSRAEVIRGMESWQRQAELRQEKIEKGEIEKPEVKPTKDTQIKPRVKRTEVGESVADALAALDKRKKQITANQRAEPQKRKFYDPHTREVAPGLLTVDAVNGLIQRFQKAVRSSKTTRDGIKRAEARFIRSLKQMGVWRQTGPETGVIGIPGGAARNYRTVSKRVGKDLTNAKAREVIGKVRPFPVPKAILSDVRAARKDADLRAGLERFLDEDALDLFDAAVGPVKYDAEYTGVADRIGELVTEGKVTGADVVNTILEIAPQNSFYRNLADRLNRDEMADVEVTFGTEADFPNGQLGKFQRSKNRVLLNRAALNMDTLQADEAFGARVVHTLTHELVHAQTHMAIDNNPTLRAHLEELQTRAREIWKQRVGGKLPYGLKVLEKSQNQAHEFVAEAFSNHEFQNFLKDTPRAPQSIGDLWEAFVNAVRRALNLPEQAPTNNLFDAILMTEDVLFDGAGFGGVMQGDLYLSGEAVIDNISSHVQNLVNKPWLDKMKNAGRNLMTFEQLHDAYTEHFTDGSFGRYMDSWKRRNAAVSKHMKLPESLSVRWTGLEAADPEGALEVSRIGTEATIDRLTPAKVLTAKERADVSDVRLKKYDELRARFVALSPEAQQLYKDVSEYYKGAQRDEANLLLSASLRGILTKGRGAKLTAEQFEQRFTRARVEKMVDKDTIKAELEDLVEPEFIEDFVKELQRMSSLRTIGAGDYFPLMRYGDYVVYASTERPDKVFDDYGKAAGERARLMEEDPTLDVSLITKGDQTILRVHEKEFWMFESKSEATKKQAELTGKYNNVSPVQTRFARDTGGMAIESNAALNTILTTLQGNPAAQAAIKQHYLKSLSDASFRKHELKRKNRRGVDYETQHRNFANYMKQSAYYRAQLQHGWRMGEALQDMEKFTQARTTDEGITTEQLGQVVKQVQMRDKMTNDNTEVMRMVRGGVNITQFMMLTSPSYWMINATQPWLVTAPIMGGTHGIGNSYSALKQAFSLIKKPLKDETVDSWFGLKAIKGDKVATEKAFNVVDQVLDHIKQSGDPRANDYVELIEELRDINIIDINVLTELRQIAEGTQGTAWTNTLDASRILAHITEVNNRVVTAIAAYNLEFNRSGDKVAAQKYAADMVSQTQFNYSSENKPPLFQPGGPLKWAAPLMFQFMQWPQHMYALLIRNVRGAAKYQTAEERAAARKSVLGLLGTHAAVGGVVGMALQPIKWALGMAMFAFGDDEEPYTFANAISGRTFDNMMADIMTELFGDKAGRALSHGLPTLIGTDLSARMSMGTLYFVDLRGDTAESITGSLVASFGGATLNQAMNWGNALGKVASGEVYRGVEQASPKILRDLLRAGRYYNEGLVNNAGDTVINAKDMSFAEVFLQGIGFSPDEVSRFYSSQTAIKGAQGYARDRRERLVRQFVDDGMTEGTMREVLEFNRAYPSLRITRSTLIRGARSRLEREARYEIYGANIDEKQAIDFARYGEPFRE